MSNSSTTFEVIIRPAAQRALRRADRPIQRRLVDAMADLADDPRPHGVKAIQGQRGLLRIRVGDYRIVYVVRDSELVIVVVTLGHRSKVYDRL
jgi:mRNA interferase RelE/StbE